MKRQKRLAYLQQIVDAGIVRDEKTKHWHMKSYLCQGCKYHDIEKEYGDFGSVFASYPICTHPIDSVVEAFNSASECGTPWWPYELPPSECSFCHHTGHQGVCWWTNGEKVESELLGDLITFTRCPCTCQVITPPRFDVTVDTVWDCWGFVPEKNAIDKPSSSLLSFST